MFGKCGDGGGPCMGGCVGGVVCKNWFGICVWGGGIARLGNGGAFVCMLNCPGGGCPCKGGGTDIRGIPTAADCGVDVGGICRECTET